MTPHRRPAAHTARLLSFTAAAALLLPLALTGCGNAGELKSAGATPTAVGPVRLWPDLPPVTAPPLDYGESDTERVPGIRVPGDDVHQVDPVKVVQVEAAADPDRYSGAGAFDDESAKAVRNCARKPKACPVLKPYYRDLTGDGKDELIVAVRMEEQLTAVRCYMAEKGGLLRIMSTMEQLVSVELAGRDLILRAASAGIPGYEYRTAWSWDEQQRAMLARRDEMVRVKPTAPQPKTPQGGRAQPEPAPEAEPFSEPYADPDAGTATGAGTGTGSGSGSGSGSGTGSGTSTGSALDPAAGSATAPERTSR